MFSFVKRYSFGLQRSAKGRLKLSMEVVRMSIARSHRMCCKVIRMDDPEEVDDLRKEVSLIKKIQDDTQAKKRLPIVLPVKAYIECPAHRKAFLWQVRADQTFEQLGTRQAEQRLHPHIILALRQYVAKGYTALYFTQEQLRDVFVLARRPMSNLAGCFMAT